MLNNIRNNAISEISTKKSLITLNEIKNAEIIKYKRRTPKQEKSLNIFNDLLDTVLADKTLKSKSQKVKNENGNDKTIMSSNEDNENENENNKILMSSNEDNENENENENETINQNEKNIKTKNLNDLLDEVIDKSKSF